MAKFVNLVLSSLLFFYSFPSFAMCSLPDLNTTSLDLCVLKYKEARFRGSSAGDDTLLSALKCRNEQRAYGEQEFQRVKSCLKLRKDSDSLRALAELYGSWSDLLNSLSAAYSGDNSDDGLNKKMSDVSKKIKILEIAM